MLFETELSILADAISLVGAAAAILPLPPPPPLSLIEGFEVDNGTPPEEPLPDLLLLTSCRISNVDFACEYESVDNDLLVALLGVCISLTLALFVSLGT